MVDWRDANVHILTHAMHYASAVFEGERAYNGKIFESREHSRAAALSASQIDFEIPWTVEEIEAAKAEVADRQRVAGRLCAGHGLARGRRGHGRRVGAQPGPPGDRRLGVGGLLR